MSDKWQKGWAVLVGTADGGMVEATERVEINYVIDGDTGLDFDRYYSIGPCLRSVAYPKLQVLDAAEGGKESFWLHPLPGAGMLGTYIELRPGQEHHVEDQGG